MKVSSSIEVIWQFAGAEAVLGEFGDIQPEHFCIALLKFSELSDERANEVVGEGETARMLTGEIESLRDALTKSLIDSTRVRRTLRAKLGKGGVRHSGGKLHRSKGSRELFQLAATLAGESGSMSLTALHLLDAIVKVPTPAISQALCGVSASPPKQTETPMLDRYGSDLIQVALQKQTGVELGRTAECKAILQVLARKKNLFLVGKTEEATRSTLAVLARSLHEDDKSRQSPERRRLIEISLCLCGHEVARSDTLHQMYGEMLAEASRGSNVILVCASSDLCVDADGREAKDAAQASRLAHTQAQCIIPIGAQEYDAQLRRDRKWNRLAETIWLTEQGQKSVPREL